jgi:hypothetical protein
MISSGVAVIVAFLSIMSTRKNFPLLVPWDSAKKVEDVLLLTDLGDCVCSVRISISVGARWTCAEIVILDVPIDPQCVIVNISAVLMLDAPKIFPNPEDFELQLSLVG